MSGDYPCGGIDLLSHTPLSMFTRSGANAIWVGPTPRPGRSTPPWEYGRNGFRGYQRSGDSALPRASARTSASTWRDVRVHINRTHVVSETNGHGVRSTTPLASGASLRRRNTLRILTRIRGTRIGRDLGTIMGTWYYISPRSSALSLSGLSSSHCRSISLG